MKFLRIFLLVCFAVFSIQLAYSQEDDESDDEQEDSGQEVKCEVSINYKDVIKVTKNNNNYTSQAETVNSHTIRAVCPGYWHGEDFSISKGDTRNTLSGNATATSSERSTTLSECADHTVKHNTTAYIDLPQCEFSFRYEKRKEDDLSSFSFFIDGVKSVSGSGANVKVCKKCQNGCESGETPYEKEYVDLIGASAVTYGIYTIQSDASTAAKMMLSMGFNLELARFGLGTITKTGPSSFVITQTVSHSQTEGTTITQHSRSVTISISPEEGPKYEAFITPVDLLTNYEKFIPLGPAITDDNFPEGYNYTGNNMEWGNSLTFEVTVFEKGTENEYSDKSQVKWSLADVSKYPGTCNNYPPRGEEDTKPDLRFVSELNTDNHLSSCADDKAVSNMDKETHMIVVTSFDYAAWGKLQADVTLENGTVLQAKLKDEDTYAVIIPKDEDMNKISDQWEIDMRIEGKDPLWDDDAKPANQRRNGDGYTLFEEYRGFKALDHTLRDASRIKMKYQHFRSDPKHKDVFVYDENDLFKTYYAAENPAELNWYLIKPEQMVFTNEGFDPMNRWVNFHKTDYHFGRQYAMHLVKRDQAPGSNSVVGAGISSPEIEMFNNDTEPSMLLGWYIKLAENLNGAPLNGNACQANPFQSPLKCIYTIEIYQGTIESLCRRLNSNAQQGIFQKLMQSTVIHEVGHGIGIEHHWKGGLANDSLVEVETMRGVLDCAMRYTSRAENRRPDQLYRDQTKYCKDGQTYEEIIFVQQLENYDPTQIQRQTFPAHNCFGMIDVKTDP